MTNTPDPNQPSENRLDRIEAMQERAQIEMAALRQILEAEATQRSIDRAADREDMSNLRKLIDSNAKAIEAAGNQQAADRDLARADRELSRADRDRSIQSREETREDIRQLAALMREDRERSLIQEREIRMQAGEIQNLADSIQVLYSRQPPPSS